MESELNGKNILIVKGSLVSDVEMKRWLTCAGARVYIATNIISAFGLLDRIVFDGAVVDQSLHNEAFDLCTELQALDVPYVFCNSPHKLPGVAIRETERALRKLANLMHRADEQAEYQVLPETVQQELRSIS